MIQIKNNLIFLALFISMLSFKCTSEDSSFNVAKLDARGTICITELHWAGSIDDSGNNDYPDDDFVELRNYTRGPIDVSGWSIHLVGDYSFVISLPEGTILNPDDFYTIGRTRRRAFPYLNQIDSDFRLPNTPFVLKVKDGAGTTSDTADFRGKDYLPGGMYLPLLRKSAIRRIEFFGPEPGDLDYNWMTYNVSTQANISSAYDSSVLASPGSSISGEGFSEDY